MRDFLESVFRLRDQRGKKKPKIKLEYEERTGRLNLTALKGRRIRGY